MVERIGSGIAMSLDEATRRLAFLLQRELRGLAERERGRAERGEEVRFDSVSRMATWETRRGDVMGRWYAEVLASYVIRDRILRWAWAGRSTIASSTHGEMIVREGQTRGVPELSMSVIGNLDELDASLLVRLGVLVARGEGIEIRRGEEEITFVGLFDSPRPEAPTTVDSGEHARYSVPPPPVTRSSPPASGRVGSNPPAPYRSLPPIREIYGTRSPRSTPPMEAAKPASDPPAAARARPQAPAPPPKVREPARNIFLPVASGVLAELARVSPGFQQALFVLSVNTEISPNSGEKRRLIVLLVANDASGTLRAIDPSREMVEAAAAMVEADRHDGNGPWRRLSARITPKPDGGATLHVDVI